MTAEALILLVRINLIASLAILLILALRRQARRLFGAHLSYALWAMVPLSVFGAMMPLDFAQGPAGLIEQATRDARAWLTADHRGLWLFALWLAGLGASAGVAVARQMRFLAAAEAGRAGPATVGVISARLVAPADFADRFTPEEWRLIRAHERAHIDRQDGRWVALAVLAEWLCWFNPLLRLAVRTFRLDQELSCDATVMERLPGERRRYAETLLRTHADPQVPTFGAAWRGAGPLEARLSMLALRPPPPPRFELGIDLLALLWMAAFITAWAAQAPYRTAPAPTGYPQSVSLTLPALGR
jgi:beta-lactamase regulating signal transducer with metallopeptidase domain